MRQNKAKQGPWTYEEKAFVNGQAGKLTPEQIAEELNRSLTGVRRYMNENGLMKYYTSAQLSQDDSILNIKKSPYWDELCTQFDARELESFQHHWENIVKQFRDDIFHTEEIQIMDMIKLELLMNRILTQQTDIKNKIEFMESAVASEKQQPLELRDIELIRNYEIQIASLYAATESISKEYREILKQKNDIFKGLKATREQRIKQVESSRDSFAGWYKSLINDPKLRQDIGVYIEKMRIATNVEYERLSELFNYADGQIDTPLLVPENQK
jgi:hypothetical protein